MTSDETKRDSIGRLTDEMLGPVIIDSCANDADMFVDLSQRCPESMGRLMQAMVQTFNKIPTTETLIGAVSVLIAIGWKAREALAESEELQRSYEL